MILKNKKLIGKILTVPYQVPVAYQKDVKLKPGRFLVQSVHIFGITVSPLGTQSTVSYGVEWQYTHDWELIEKSEG